MKSSEFITESFPYDVDHMPGKRGINLPSKPATQKFDDEDEWIQTVNKINSEKYDDNSDFITSGDGYVVEINGKVWAKWNGNNETGWIK